MEQPSTNFAIDDLPTRFAVLQAANHIAHLLGKTNLLEPAIEPLINEFIELVQADCGSIQLPRPGSERTQRTLVRKSKSQEEVFDSHLENLITGWILKHRSPLLTDDIASHIKLGAAAKRYVNISSLLTVPITQQENVIGVVNLIRVRPTEPFSEQQAQMVSALAQETADFIEQAHIWEQLFSDYQKLRQEVSDRYSLHGIQGRSPAMNEVFSILDRVIPTEGRVLLQEGEIRPIGSNQSRKVDVRIITAASIDLNQRIVKGEFRSDLFFRLNVVSIRLPALRERVEDIPTLAASFLKRFAEKHGKQLRHIDRKLGRFIGKLRTRDIAARAEQARLEPDRGSQKVEYFGKSDAV